ncbi:MAG: glycosyltransferase family 39 protein [Candidatus Omnitrophota bacterium]
MMARSRLKRILSVEALGWAILLLALAAALTVRLRMLDIPLERDEGEYAYTGQLLLQGVPPYKLAYSMKLPGTPVAYALVMAAFGRTIQGIHLGLLLINLAAVMLIFLISKRLSGILAATSAAAAYALLSVSQSVLGFAAHATHFVVIMALCGVFFLLKAQEADKKYIFLSGIFFGLAFLMKQQGIFFVLLGIFWLSYKSSWRAAAVYALGAAIPFAAACLFLFLAGVFPKFWFWVFQYAPHYSSGLRLDAALKLFQDQLLQVIRPFWPLWCIAALGFFCGKNRIFLIAFAAASFLTILPGFIFREHYFVTLLPAVALLAGSAVSSAAKKSAVPIFIFGGLLIISIFQQRHYLFQASPAEVSRKAYGANPFAESPEIARYLKANSSPEDIVAVLGSEPQVYFYANRRSATGYIYTYPLMEKQPYALRMQDEMIREIEKNNPRYLVFVNVPASWLRRSDSADLIFSWAQRYLADGYALDKAIRLQPSYTALIYRRRSI